MRKMRWGKRLIPLALLLLACALLLPLLCYGPIGIALFRATGLNYTDEVPEGSFRFLTREKRPGTLFYRSEGKKAAVRCLTLDPDSGITVFTIPDSFGDYPVVGLGGYVGRGVPCPFQIYVKGVHSTLGVSPEAGSFSPVDGTRAEIIYHDLRLNLGANVREIHANQSGMFVKRGEDKGEIHVVRVYFHCDSANPDFYSENGRLYDKKGKLVKGFFWWDEEFGG